MNASQKKKYIDAVHCLAKKKNISDIPGARNIFDDFQGTHSQQTPDIHFVVSKLPATPAGLPARPAFAAGQRLTTFTGV